MEVFGRHHAGTAVRGLHLQELAVRLGRGPDEANPKPGLAFDRLARLRHAARIAAAYWCACSQLRVTLPIRIRCGWSPTGTWATSALLL